jgi:prolyl-tRNA editing enzyme YbaK/EbsC (Cys-tRNA(Pro) deacylase)
MDYPITAAIRFLREKNVDFVPHLYDYVEKGGTAESARQLGVDEHAIVKTLARHLGVKSVEPATHERANKLTGYLVGGTSPFGTRTAMPVYVEKTIFALDKIYINGGKRGFLVEIEPNLLPKILKVEEVEVGITN